MWPFRNRKHQSRPAWELPVYDVDGAASPNSSDAVAGLDDRPSANSVETSRSATMPVPFTNWGQLELYDAGLKGIAAVLGLFANTHAKCTHWWCLQPDQPFNLLAEIWYSPNAPDQCFPVDCITAEICAVRDVADDNSSASFSRPLYKLFIQCTAWDAVAVYIANIIDPPISEPGEMGIWQVDMANLERLLVKPNAVSDISDGPTFQGDQSTIFLLRRAGGLVHYGRLYRHLLFDREVFATPPEVTSYEELAERRAAELFDEQG